MTFLLLHMPHPPGLHITIDYIFSLKWDCQFSPALRPIFSDSECFAAFIFCTALLLHVRPHLDLMWSFNWEIWWLFLFYDHLYCWYISSHWLSWSCLLEHNLCTIVLHIYTQFCTIWSEVLLILLFLHSAQIRFVRQALCEEYMFPLTLPVVCNVNKIFQITQSIPFHFEAFSYW